MNKNNILLSVRDLSVTVGDQTSQKFLVDRASFSVGAQKIVALVGGSGSGKTTIGLSILRLLAPALRIQSGEVFFQNQNLLELSIAQMRLLRGGDIAMVFQEPLYAFNPVFTIEQQIDEVLMVHTPLSPNDRRKNILNVLDKAGIVDAKRVARSYPHQLSGGMRQRAMIAQAIACEPKLIIADEPTSNLDVTRQALIMELFRKLKDELKLSILIISHDLGMVEHLADEVVVLQKGTVVEMGTTQEVLQNPRHEYTRQLMNAVR